MVELRGVGMQVLFPDASSTGEEGGAGDEEKMKDDHASNGRLKEFQAAVDNIRKEKKRCSEMNALTRN